jgi:hypothetical protein
VFWKDGHGRYVGCNGAYLASRGIETEADLLGRDETDLALDDGMTQALRDLESRVTSSEVPIVNRKMDLRDSQARVRALLRAQDATLTPMGTSPTRAFGPRPRP